MNKIRVRRQVERNIYMHNDLLSAAHYFMERIKDRLDRDDREGIFHECLACLAMIAFGFEATINFFGHKLVQNWKERNPFDTKVDQVFAQLELNPDWNVRPYSSVRHLKKFRDMVAHGKPVEISIDEEVEVSPEEAHIMTDPHELDGEWEEYCTSENVSDIYDDINAIRELMQKEGPEMITDTNGHASLTLIDN